MAEEPLPPNPPPLSAPKGPPGHPVALEYGRGRYAGDHPRVTFVAQFAIGFVFWGLMLLMAFVVAGALGGLYQSLTRSIGFNDASAFGFSLALGAFVVVVIGLSLWIRIKYRWRGFIPGVLLGIGLTCLVPIGFVVVVCGNWK